MKSLLPGVFVLAALAAALPLAAQPEPQSPPPPPQGAYPQGPQAAGPDGDEPETPGRGVARISVLNGEVSVRRGDSGDLVAAALNAPMMLDDRLLTSTGSRAEVQFDSSNMVRLGPATEVRFVELEYRRYQVQLASGTIVFRVLRDASAQIEISTPSVSVRPVRTGIYRVTVLPDGTSEITVRGGEAEIYTPKGVERLRAGNTMLARGNPSDPEFQTMRARGADDFDRWSENRDRDLERSRSYGYVSRDIYGAEDLDNYGRWDYDPAYGNVWVPQVAADWAPYRYGRWSWADYYGWTWVSYDPWGWAPYHWGNWYFRTGFGWCWWPGAIHQRYFWRPAVVGFFGWGGGFGFGFGFGHVGWVPLAPFEAFRPWYGRGIYGGYRNAAIINNRTTIINNTNIYNIYRNARVDNGVTSIRSNEFGRAGVTNANFVRTSQRDLQQAGMVRGQLPLTPDRASLRLTDREAARGQMPASSDNARFFSRNRPVQADRVPFEQQQRGVDQLARRSFGGDAGRGQAVQPAAADRGGFGRSNAPQAGPQSGGMATDNGRGGWRAIDGNAGRVTGGAQPNPSAAGTPQARGFEGNSRTAGQPDGVRGDPASQGRDNGGWRRFGDPSGSRVPGSANGYRGDAAPTAPGASPAGGAFGGNSGRGSGPANNGGSDRGWQRFEGSPQRQPRGLDGQGQGPGYRPDTSQRGSRNDVPRYNAPGGYNNGNSGGGRGYYGSPSSEPVRISPPIVRERYMPPPSGGPSYSGPRGGGPSYSAPSYSGPRGGGPSYSAPPAQRGGGGGGAAPSYSAPRGGGGGGGGSRGGGGGGSSHGGRSR